MDYRPSPSVARQRLSKPFAFIPFRAELLATRYSFTPSEVEGPLATSPIPFPFTLFRTLSHSFAVTPLFATLAQNNPGWGPPLRLFLTRHSSVFLTPLLPYSCPPRSAQL